ncbi:ANTAR domain-containing protein [Kineococcus sp. R8]|uniref:ANTAR domain-containing response regulator n=1 Tax=Kineococcus siccus TaxID=2696567 RepID=UPI0014133599|nr:ANTAR domain-containing protein [Kineococcus siccus]NAZ82482.1 ANTAR domain-containing protein [Kineococcus siccus]
MHGSSQPGLPGPQVLPAEGGDRSSRGAPPGDATNGDATNGGATRDLAAENAALHEELDRLREEVLQLRAALSRRPTIDLAKGVVMAMTGHDEDQAFRELSQISQTHNVKLYDLASALLADLPAVRACGGGLLQRDWGGTS